MAKRARISVATGEYKKSDGSMGTDWLNIGTIITKDDGKQFMELIPYINYTALPRKDGKLYASIFDVEHKSSGQQASPAQDPKAGVDDDIPF